MLRAVPATMRMAAGALIVSFFMSLPWIGVIALGYAMVYPVAMVVKILVAQVLTLV